MGAHPRAPSFAITESGDLSLQELIAGDPAGLLGARVAQRFGGRLPFLLKVLAAAEPLSIQAHPSLEQARLGFARENAKGIPLGDPGRNYADDNHKPEVLCALTRFYALSGFRDPRESMRLLRAFDLAAAAEAGERAVSAGGANAGLYRALLALPPAAQLDTVARLAAAARLRQSELPEARWVLRALAAHPGDFGAVSVLFLNLVELEPGQALYQDAGVLHAYLQGTGIELMANSDNVMRGGLTTKRVDSAELLRVVDFGPAAARRVEPVPGSGTEQVYVTPAAEFRLSRLPLHGRWTPGPRSGIEIWVVTQGAARVEWGHEALALRPGDSFVVPASAGDFALDGAGVLFRATVPSRD